MRFAPLYELIYCLKAHGEYLSLERTSERMSGEFVYLFVR